MDGEVADKLAEMGKALEDFIKSHPGGDVNVRVAGDSITARFPIARVMGVAAGLIVLSSPVIYGVFAIKLQTDFDLRYVRQEAALEQRKAESELFTERDKSKESRLMSIERQLIDLNAKVDQLRNRP